MGKSPRPFQGGSRDQELVYNNTKTFCSIHFVDICTDNTKGKTSKTAEALTQINSHIFHAHGLFMV